MTVAQSEIVRIFETNRPHLMGLAYRMSGSVADAEDLIQDAWLRWHETDHAVVICPKAYLLRLTMRLCLDRARSAQARREFYVGPWLPEPIADLAQLAADPGPQSIAERTDELSIALLLVLERLSPLERAAFLLHDVFDFSFDEIAATLQRTPWACRKLASRARQRIKQERPARSVPPELAKQFTARFHRALQSGDLATFAEMLAEDAVLIADGGGKTYAALKPIYGRDHIVRFLVGIASKFGWPKEIRRLPAQRKRRFCHHGGRWRPAHLVSRLEPRRPGHGDPYVAQSRQTAAPAPKLWWSGAYQWQRHVTSLIGTSRQPPDGRYRISPKVVKVVSVQRPTQLYKSGPRPIRARRQVGCHRPRRSLGHRVVTTGRW